MIHSRHAVPDAQGRIGRRAVVALLGGAAAWPTFAVPTAAWAQRSSLPVVGFVGVLSQVEAGDLVAAFNQGLNGNGFLDGRNIAVEPRWAEGQYGRLPALIADLVRRRAIVIVATGSGTAVLEAKKQAEGIIPIVFVEGDLDPVKDGLVASLQQPGANITGVLLSSPTFWPKRVEMLADAAPGIEVIGMLANPQSLDAKLQVQQAEAAARALGLRLSVASAANEDDIDNAFAGPLVKPQVGALLVADDIFLLSQRGKIVEAAATNSLPAIYPHRAYVIAGGLMSYAANLPDAYREAGKLTAEVLLGRQPAELPVQQAGRLELIVNRKTANALQVPPAVMSAADRILE